MIIIFGAPGAGKTTQIELLRKNRPDVVFQAEPTEGVKELIQETHKGVQGALFRLQMHVLEHRCRGYAESSTHLVVADGHIRTDFLMFVQPRIDDGTLTGEELNSYMRSYDQARASFSLTHNAIRRLIFLKVGGKVAARRVSLRASQGEDGVDNALFEDFAKRSVEVVNRFNPAIVSVVDADQDVAAVQKEILALLQE